MNRHYIISNLSDGSRLPWTCLSRCLRAPEDCVPLFLLLLERKSRDLPLSEDEERALYFGVHVLAALRVTDAFEPVSSILKKPPRTVAEVFGDAIADTLPQVLMSISSGQATPCWEAAGSAQLDWLVREAFLRCWTYHAVCGDVTTEDSVTKLERFPEDGDLQPDSFLWPAWLTAIADLGLDCLAKTVEDVIASGRIRMNSVSVLSSDIDVFHQDLLDAKTARNTAADLAAWRQRKRYTPFAGSHEDFVRAGRYVLTEGTSFFHSALSAAEDPDRFDEQ